MSEVQTILNSLPNEKNYGIFLKRNFKMASFYWILDLGVGVHTLKYLSYL